MFTEIVKYPDTYIDAKVMLENCLTDSPHLRFRAFEGWYTRPCEVNNFFIEEVEDIESPSNLTLNLTYDATYLTEEKGFQTIERVRKLRILSARGDDRWTYRLIEKVWEGQYPSTVAIDLETHEVFFMNITVSGLDLIHFGVLDERQFEAFDLEVNDRHPFRVKISEQALMNFVDGGEGVNHLRRNIVIELDCGIPLDIPMNTPTHHTDN